jgi:hypothetical protein
MRGLYPTVWAEILKVRKSKILIITLLAFPALVSPWG